MSIGHTLPLLGLWSTISLVIVSLRIGTGWVGLCDGVPLTSLASPNYRPSVSIVLSQLDGSQNG